jgi:hypothetical protein
MDKKLIDEWQKLNNVLIGTTKGGRSNQLINFVSEGKTISVKCFGDVTAGDAIALRDDDGQWYAISKPTNSTNRQFSNNRQYRKTKIKKQEENKTGVPILFSKKVAPPDLWRLYIKYVGGRTFGFAIDCSIREQVFYAEVPQGVTPSFYLNPSLWQPFGYSDGGSIPPFNSTIPVPSENSEKVENFVIKADYPADYLKGGNGNGIVMGRYSDGLFGSAFNNLISYSLLGSFITTSTGTAWDDVPKKICNARVLEVSLTKSTPEEYNTDLGSSQSPYTPIIFTEQYFIGGDREEPLDLDIKTFGGFGLITTTEDAKIVSIPYAGLNLTIRENQRLITLRVNNDDGVSKAVSPPYTNAEDDFRKSYTQFLTDAFPPGASDGNIAVPPSGDICIDIYQTQRVNIFDNVIFTTFVPQSITRENFTTSIIANEIAPNQISQCVIGNFVASQEIEIFKLAKNNDEADLINFFWYAPIIAID